jgi:hypothetical protein
MSKLRVSNGAQCNWSMQQERSFIKICIQIAERIS